MKRIAMLSMVAILGCGGGQKGATEPNEDDGEGVEVSGEGAEDPCAGVEFCSPEKLDEIQQAFNMKRKAVARCYEDAVSSGTLDKKTTGRVTVEMTITTAGRAKDIKVTKDTIRSDALNDCITETIGTWDLPEPEAPTPFAFSYDFEPE